MDQLEHYRIFLRVAELGGFTRAADSLGLPKASVSTAVRRLEAELGTQLFHRTTRRVQLTGDGALFLERCRDFLGEAEELQSMFRREPQQLSGRVRIGMSGGMARQLVLPRLGAFLEAHPGLQIELGAGERRVDVVREGYDCVVRTGDVVDPSLVARRLGLAPVVTCASPAYLERHGMPRTLEDLASHRLVQFAVAFGQKPEGFEYPLPGGGHASLELPGAVIVDNGEAYVGAALAGLGTGIAGPSRDMLIKRAAPPGATGRVYGMVYSGLDLGFAVAPPLLGLLMDRGAAAGIFHAAAFALVFAVVSATWVGTRVAASPRRAATA